MKRISWLIALAFSFLLLGLSLTIVRHNNRLVYGQSIEFRGRYVCLEHKNQSGPQTRECSGGFSNGSKVYEIDNKDYYNTHPNISIGEGEYEITGILQPAGEYYSSDGIIKITDLKLVK